MKDERVARNIRLRRVVLGLTQEKLEELTRIDQSTLSRWEQGKSVPDLLEAERLVLALQCTVQDLLNRGVLEGSVTITFGPKPN